MTTRDNTAIPASDPKEWIDLRDEEGLTQARYNPGLHLLIIQRRGKKTIHDLRRYRQDELCRSCAEERPLLLQVKIA